MELLLDHLKRVAVKANTNKMTTQNVAVCFGPVLLCPSLKSTTGQDALDFRKHIEVLQYLLDIWPERTGTSLPVAHCIVCKCTVTLPVNIFHEDNYYTCFRHQINATLSPAWIIVVTVTEIYIL